MKSFVLADLERLAHGHRVASDVFRAIFADSAAVADLARLVEVRELLAAAEPEPRGLGNLPDMDVSFEELAYHGEGQPLEPGRRAAVERFLEKHFPDGIVAADERDTIFDVPDGQKTDFEAP